jgi:hypothetical protein
MGSENLIPTSGDLLISGGVTDTTVGFVMSLFVTKFIRKFLILY